ncbi:MAG: hypothetical protein JW751_03695 [Polyangiaceae bacterium]|nr:hypothetical protein [Polyangiaceae bacterium]
MADEVVPANVTENPIPAAVAVDEVASAGEAGVPGAALEPTAAGSAPVSPTSAGEGSNTDTTTAEAPPPEPAIIDQRSAASAPAGPEVERTPTGAGAVAVIEAPPPGVLLDQPSLSSQKNVIDGSLAPSELGLQGDEKRRGSKGGLVGLLLAALVLLLGGLFLLRHDLLDRSRAASPTPEPSTKVAAQQAAAGPKPPPTAAPRTEVAATTHTASEARSQEAGAVPSPTPSAEEASAIEVQQVTITVIPPKGRIIEKGKLVGTSGTVVEVEPGRRRIFEVQHDGYVARRLVVDGSNPEVRVWLRQAAQSTEGPTGVAEGPAAGPATGQPVVPANPSSAP